MYTNTVSTLNLRPAVGVPVISIGLLERLLDDHSASLCVCAMILRLS